MKGRRWTPVEDLAVLADRPLAEIADTLDRSIMAVEQRRWHLRQRDIATHVCTGLCPSCGGTPPLWPPEKIVQAIRAWNDTHGHPPSRDEWRYATYEHPTIETVDRVFGTLTRATLAAGLTPRKPGPAKVWTRDKIREAIQRWANRHGGKPPRKIDWMHSAPDHPTCETVVLEWKGDGGWNGAISDAGYFPRGKWGHRYATAERTTRIAA